MIAIAASDFGASFDKSEAVTDTFDQKVEYLKNLAHILKISDQERFDLIAQRESNIGTMRNLIEVILNGIVRNIIRENRNINSNLIFGFNEPTFGYLIKFLANHQNSIPINAYELVNQIIVEIKNWPDSSGVAYGEALYYFQQQLRTKLGEGVRLDSEGLDFKGYLEGSFDGNSDMTSSLISFIDEYDLRQRISTHSLNYEGVNNISNLRSHNNVYSDLQYLTREPIENRNLRLLELLKNKENSVVIEISPPFYNNEDDFIVRISILENGEWRVTSIFLPLKKSSRERPDYSFINEFAKELQLNIANLKYLKDSRVFKTSKRTKHVHKEKEEMLELFSSVNYFRFSEKEKISEILTQMVNRSIYKTYGIENGLGVLNMNDKFVSGEIDGKLMPKVNQYSRMLLSTILNEIDRDKCEYLAAQFGAVIHTSKTTLLSDEELEAKKMDESDKLKIRSGAFIDAAIEDGKSGVDEIAATLTTGILESSFDTSCGETNERYGNKIDLKSVDTSSWRSTSEIQHIEGIGSFVKVTKVDPNHPENKIVFYKCNICGSDGIDGCEVSKGCSECGATYDNIIEKSKKGFFTPNHQTFRKKAKGSGSLIKAKTHKAVKSVQSSRTADDIANGFINMLSLGIASRIDES